MNSIHMPQTKHEGRNVKRIREMFGIKQEAFGEMLGLTQQQVSLLEQKETLDQQVRTDVARALKVPVEAIENFDEDFAVNIISNTFTDNSILNGINYNPTFNPIEKFVEAVEENKKLYEQLLQSEREKVELLQTVLKNKN